MKHLFILSTLASACQIPAFAGEPTSEMPPQVAAMANAKKAPREFKIDEQTLGAIQGYLGRSQILYSVKCQENSAHWFCDASAILKRISEQAKEIKDVQKDSDSE